MVAVERCACTGDPRCHAVARKLHGDGTARFLGREGMTNVVQA